MKAGRDIELSAAMETAQWTRPDFIPEERGRRAEERVAEVRGGEIRSGGAGRRSGGDGGGGGIQSADPAGRGRPLEGRGATWQVKRSQQGARHPPPRIPLCANPTFCFAPTAIASPPALAAPRLGRPTELARQYRPNQGSDCSCLGVATRLLFSSSAHPQSTRDATAENQKELP
ncbi:hypothetical protein BDY21DRAFT_146616 [Lineolata rhizophorae]|uniref:Uncharacterized protein n=1 Tax=Lineolata rhizophorae TaxID=578093 RepID=A0A6A6NN68_9PEZI|nr:hypothetical protein BDY21DRAFT_146616 [Lineolata rhizophorae]